MLMDYSNSLFFLEQSKSLSKTLSFQHILNFYQAGLLSLGKHLWDCLSNWELTLTNWQSNIRCECTLLYYGTEKRFLRVHWIFVWVQPILLILILVDWVNHILFMKCLSSTLEWDILLKMFCYVWMSKVFSTVVWYVRILK